MNLVRLASSSTGLQINVMTGCHSCQLSIINLLYINFQGKQLNSRRFPVFPEGISNSSRFPVFPEIVDTLANAFSSWYIHDWNRRESSVIWLSRRLMCVSSSMRLSWHCFSRCRAGTSLDWASYSLYHCQSCTYICALMAYTTFRVTTLQTMWNSPTFPGRFAALPPMLSVTHNMPVLVLLSVFEAVTAHDPKPKWNARTQQSQEWTQICS